MGYFFRSYKNFIRSMYVNSRLTFHILAIPLSFFYQDLTILSEVCKLWNFSLGIILQFIFTSSLLDKIVWLHFIPHSEQIVPSIGNNCLQKY